MAATTHRHGAGCGHTAIEHEGHVDYLHEAIFSIRRAVVSTST
jgi:hypothetical protein